LLRIIDRYLLRELGASLAGATVVLLLVTLGAALTEVLDKVARGKIPPALLLSQVGLRAVDGLTVLLPLAAFLAVLLAYGRLYRDSEMAVFAASGMPSRALLRPLLLIALPLSTLVALLAFWWGPAALRLSDRMIEVANRSLLVAGLEPGRFTELPGRPGEVYVGSMDPDGSKFRKIFLYLEREDRVDIVTAERGEMYSDHEGNERYLGLREGYRVEGIPGQPDFRTMRFKDNDIRLPDSSKDIGGRAETRSGSLDLAASEKSSDTAELWWRASMPITATVLLLLAFPLARSRPREPRYGKALFAVMAFVAYVGTLAVARGWLAVGSLPAWLGLWWVHALVAFITLLLIVQGDRIAKPGAS
jgi:lipopolysaccharide export system permease protein